MHSRDPSDAKTNNSALQRTGEKRTSIQVQMVDQPIKEEFLKLPDQQAKQRNKAMTRLI